MLVLAAVPEVQLQRLRRAAGVRFTFVRAASWDEVLAAIRARPVELAVLDPTLGGEARAQELERLRLLFPSLPLILYTALTPQLAAVLLALGKHGIRHVIFVRYDDHPERLREVLEREASGAASRRLLDQLADRLSPLPTELRWVLEEALRTPEEVRTVGRLAARGRGGPRTCQARFTRVGLPTPRHFLAAPRVLYAHPLVQDPGFTIEDVAVRLGARPVKTVPHPAPPSPGLDPGRMAPSAGPHRPPR